MKQKYFMGMSTPKGYETNFYNEYSDYYGFYLKGGPGTGKSTLMKQIAERFGEENISVYYCSSDPNSVDAVVLEDRKIFVADTTSPHEGSTRLPFVTGELVDLAQSLNRKALRDVKNQVYALSEENLAYHKLTKKYLYVIGAMQKNIISIGKECVNKELADKFISGLADKITNRCDLSRGVHTVRQRIANTPYGKLWYLPEGCRIIAFKDNYLYLAMHILYHLKLTALQSGYRVEESRAMAQKIIPELLIYIPQLNTALCSEQNLTKEMKEQAEITNLSSLYNITIIKESDEYVRECSKIISKMEKAITTTLSEALKNHDQLEKYYIEALNREWLNEKCEDIYKKIKFRG